jgi:protein-tyrosine phosphatase
MKGKFGVLFICAGNICRSPLAEVVFKDLLKKRGLEKQFWVESRGTGEWHEGCGADKRSVQVAKKNGLNLHEHIAHQVTPKDMEEFDLFVAMDRSNLSDLRHRFPKSEFVLFRSYDPKDIEKDVPDPYYGGVNGFDDVYDIVSRCGELLLDWIIEHRGKELRL